MNLYLIRHGQSVANFEHRHSGWTQLPLTEQGFADARRAGERLRGIPFDRIYSSDLRRAIQTAQTALPGCELIQLPQLRERSVGILAERLVADCFAEYGETYVRCRETLDFTPYGGENIDMQRARAEEFLRILEADPCENVAAFSHEGLLGCMLEIVLNFQLDRRRIRIPNGSILHFTYEDNLWRYMV